MQSKYPNILSPLKVGNVMLKNRLVGSVALPHYLQGPELFPNEQVIQHVSNIAKNGAAIVVFSDWSNMTQRKVGNIDGRHFPMYDLTDESVLNYLSQLADAVHYYNSLVSIQPSFFNPKGLYIVDSPACTPEEAGRLASEKPVYRMRLMTGEFGQWQQITEDEIEAYTDSVADRMYFYKMLGYDMCTIHMAYCMTFLGQFLSPLTNFRTDQFGGSLENRARVPLSLFRKIKQRCGQDFLVEVEISGQEEPGGLTTEDMIDFGRMAEGLIDIFQVRAETMDTAQPVPFNAAKGQYRTISFAEEMKKAGVPQKIEVVGGYDDIDDSERFLAQGKTDLIGLARSFICEPEYVKKIQEGRGEDIVPCIRCNRCHGLNLTGPWISVCSVNPVMGLAHKIDQMNPPVDRVKRVAVIGGGPAGMKAALVAAQRGHNVTLFEEKDVLGGQLCHSDYSEMKWTIRRYKDYLIRQLEKSTVDVRLNTKATPEMIEAEHFEVVLAATGAVPKLPNIPGADTSGAWMPVQVYGHENELGERVIVVGGAETGCETALHLAELGHQVTLLSRQDALAKEATPTHYRAELLRRMTEEERLEIHIQARTTLVKPGSVTYEDSTGVYQLKADDIVLCGGVRPLQDEAMAFYGSAAVFDYIGDCRKPGNIQTCTRQAYAAASQI